MHPQAQACGVPTTEDYSALVRGDLRPANRHTGALLLFLVADTRHNQQPRCVKTRGGGD